MTKLSYQTLYVKICSKLSRPDLSTTSLHNARLNIHIGLPRVLPHAGAAGPRSAQLPVVRALGGSNLAAGPAGRAARAPQGPAEVAV